VSLETNWSMMEFTAHKMRKKRLTGGHGHRSRRSVSSSPVIILAPYQDSHRAKGQRTVINRLDCGFLQLVVVTSEELEYKLHEGANSCPQAGLPEVITLRSTVN